MTPFQAQLFALVTRWPRRWLWYWSWLYHFSALVWTGSFHGQRIFIAGEGVGVESKETERVDVVLTILGSDVFDKLVGNDVQRILSNKISCSTCHVWKDVHFNHHICFFLMGWNHHLERTLMNFIEGIGVWDKPVNLEGALAFCSLHF